MTLNQSLLALALGLPKESFEFKEYGNRGKKMATTRTIQLPAHVGPVPGQDGKVGRYQVTFNVNIMDIGSKEAYAQRTESNAQSAVDALPSDERRAFLEAELAKLTGQPA